MHKTNNNLYLIFTLVVIVMATSTSCVSRKNIPAPILNPKPVPVEIDEKDAKDLFQISMSKNKLGMTEVTSKFDSVVNGMFYYMDYTYTYDAQRGEWHYIRTPQYIKRTYINGLWVLIPHDSSCLIYNGKKLLLAFPQTPRKILKTGNFLLTMWYGGYFFLEDIINLSAYDVNNGKLLWEKKFKCEEWEKAKIYVYDDSTAILYFTNFYEMLDLKNGKVINWCWGSTYSTFDRKKFKNIVYLTGFTKKLSNNYLPLFLKDRHCTFFNIYGGISSVREVDKKLTIISPVNNSLKFISVYKVNPDSVKYNKKYFVYKKKSPGAGAFLKNWAFNFVLKIAEGEARFDLGKGLLIASLGTALFGEDTNDLIFSLQSFYDITGYRETSIGNYITVLERNKIHGYHLKGKHFDEIFKYDIKKKYGMIPLLFLNTKPDGVTYLLVEESEKNSARHLSTLALLNKNNLLLARWKILKLNIKTGKLLNTFELSGTPFIVNNTLLWIKPSS